MSRLFDIFLKLGVIGILIEAATTNQQYSYYTFVRWIVMTSSIYFAYQAYNKRQTGLIIFYCALGILFNPFQKFWFQKETWHLIDYLVAGILALTIVFDWTRKDNEK